MATSQNSSALDGVPTAKSVGYGVASYVVTYAIFFVLKGSEGVQEFRTGFEQGAGSTFQQLGIDPPSAFQVAGWVFYLAHNAGIEISVSAMGQSQTLNMNPGLGQEAYLMAIPPIVLVAAGYLIASREAPVGASLPKVGASIAAGYVILSLVGVFAFAWTVTITGGFGQEASLTVKPQLVMGVLAAGLIYPALFGGIGGFIAQSQTPDRRTGTRPGAHHGTQSQYGQQPAHGQQSQRPRQGQRQQGQGYRAQGQQQGAQQHRQQGQQPAGGQQSQEGQGPQQDDRSDRSDDDRERSDRHR